MLAGATTFDVLQEMKTLPIGVFLIATGICFAAEPSDFIPFKVPEGATQVDNTRISIPLAHKAKSALLLFDNSHKDKLFCELRPDQASELAGAEYTAIEGLKPILVRWSFMEPANAKEQNLVIAHRPAAYVKDHTLYISSSGINIGDVGKVVEGVLIVQVASNPEKIVFKLSKVGW